MNTKMLNIINNPKRWLYWKKHTIGFSCCCYVCGGRFGRFMPLEGKDKSTSPFLAKVNSVGSDVNNFLCPLCSCYDRERHLLMYFDSLNLWEFVKNKRVLHFAPESNVVRRITVQNPDMYIKADLFPGESDIAKIDVTDIPYNNHFFDFVICNHVLEHVEDVKRALSELFRIIKHGGHAVLQTPHSTLLKNSFSDPAINTDGLRNYFYGHEDHVCLYGKDIFSLMQSAGFKLYVKKHTDVLSDYDASIYGVNADEDLILVGKA